MSKKKRKTWPNLPDPLSAQVMDNHCHLPVTISEERCDSLGCSLSLAEQIIRAELVGVTNIVTSAWSLNLFEASISAAYRYPSVRLSLGIHPNEAPLHQGYYDRAPDGFYPIKNLHHDHSLAEALDILESYLNHEMVVSIGESGLDYYRIAESGRRVQQDSFRSHIKLANSYDLPLQIHDRDAHEDVVSILLQETKKEQKIIFHSYSADEKIAKILNDNGWYASFSGTVTYPRNESIRKALTVMDRSLVLVETDAPYLPVQLYRGCPNASYLLPILVRFIADIWQETEEYTCNKLWQNSLQVYGSW